MVPRRIVLCYPLESRHLERIRAAARGCEVVDAGQERIATEILTADVFCGHAKVPVPWDDVVRAGQLRWIQSSAAGLDHCLVPSVIASDIRVSSASGLFAKAVAEQALALLLGLIRRIPVFFRAQLRREFERQPTDDLHGRTVGIVGLGGNGCKIAQLLTSFGVELLATDVFPEWRPPYVEQVYPADQLERLLKASDVVILCVPLNDQTRGLIDRRALSWMRRGSYLINVARGPVVREQDLVEALQSGQLAGAGLDVTEVEPLPADSPLWDLPQVLITPHVGAQSADRLDVTTQLFCDNLRRYARGERLINLVDKQLGFPRPGDRLGV